MKTFAHKVVKTARLMRAHFPTVLPVSTQGFEVFMKDVFDLYALPDLPSYRQAIASLVMHLPATKHAAPKRFFGVAVKKAMANQIAYEVIDAIREADKKAAQELAEAEKQKAHAILHEPAIQ